MQARKRNLPTNKSKIRSVEKTLTDIALLIEISQFLEDRELFNFIIITKRTYNVIKRSTALEVRLLKYELANAEKTLKKYKTDTDFHPKNKKGKFKDMMSFRYNLMLQPRLPLNTLDPVMISQKVKDYFDLGKALLLKNQTEQMSKLNKFSDQSPFANYDFDLMQEWANAVASLDEESLEVMVNALQRSRESQDKLIIKMLRANFIKNNMPLDGLNDMIDFVEARKQAQQTKHTNDPPTQPQTLSKKLSDIVQDIGNYLYNGPKYVTKHL